jgi:hypothetical protein
MPMLGQASGGFTESSSALRLLHVGVRNTVGVLVDDAFTQTNPPVVTAAATVTTQVDQTENGVLSGSVAFTRPEGSNWIAGPGDAATLIALSANGQQSIGFKALGCFINSANGNAFENTPGTASGKGPYVSAQGTYGNALYETAILDGTNITGFATGDAITYSTGLGLMASANGYLMPTEGADVGGTVRDFDVAGGGAVFLAAESWVYQGGTAGSATHLAVVKMPPDAVQNELVYDQRI